jgi:hypothetical protein
LAAILNISAILNYLNTQQAIFDLSWSRLQKFIMKSVLTIIAHGTLFSYKLNPTIYFVFRIKTDLTKKLLRLTIWLEWLLGYETKKAQKASILPKKKSSTNLDNLFFGTF